MINDTTNTCTLYSSAHFLLGGRAAGGICWRRSPGGGGVLPSSRTGGRLGGGTEYGKSGTLAAAAASDCGEWGALLYASGE
jgi:hypothetical protein